MWRTFPGRRTADERIFLTVLVATQDRTVAVSRMLSGERAQFSFLPIYKKVWYLVSAYSTNDCANLDRWIGIQRLSCFFSLFFLQLPKPNQRRRDCLLPPPTASCAAAHAWPHRTLKIYASSLAPVRSRLRPHHRPPPWFARRGGAHRCCQHGQQPTGIRR